MIEYTGTAISGGLVAGSGSFSPRISEKNAPTRDFSAPPRRPNADSQDEAGGLRLSNDDGDEAVLSQGAVAARDRARAEGAIQEEEREANENAAADSEENQDPGELTDEEQDQVTRLQARDREVRTHEQAHLSAAGDLALGGPKYDYQRGPDGKRYAVGGEVEIDTSEVPNDPQATLSRAERIKRSALAPAEPSGQDRRVAAKADQMANKARREIAEEALTQDAESGAATTDAAAATTGPTPANTQDGATTTTATERPGGVNAGGRARTVGAYSAGAAFGENRTSGFGAANAPRNDAVVTYSAQGRGLGARGGLVSLVG